MAAKFLLKNLFALSKSMKRESLDYQVINDIQYKKDLQLCALFKLEYEEIKNKSLEERTENKNYILGLFKRKTNEYFELPLKHKVNNGFEAFELHSDSEGVYKGLIQFLEVSYSEDGPFQPFSFFKKLHEAIPTKASSNNLDRLVCSYSYPTSRDNERNKIYFSHFLNNAKGKKRSLENYEKTEKLLPYANKIIGSRNISVCFTPDQKDELVEMKDIDENIKKYSSN